MEIEKVIGQLDSLPEKWCIKVKVFDYNCLPLSVYKWRMSKDFSGWARAGYIDIRPQELRYKNLVTYEGETIEIDGINGREVTCKEYEV